MHRCGPEILIYFACIFGKYGMATNVINGTDADIQEHLCHICTGVCVFPTLYLLFRLPLCLYVIVFCVRIFPLQNIFWT